MIVGIGINLAQDIFKQYQDSNIRLIHTEEYKMNASAIAIDYPGKAAWKTERSDFNKALLGIHFKDKDVVSPNAKNKNIEEGRVFLKEGKVWWKCRNCGYVYEAVEAMDICPACQHPKSFMELKEDNY